MTVEVMVHEKEDVLSQSFGLNQFLAQPPPFPIIDGPAGHRMGVGKLAAVQVGVQQK